MTAAVHTDGRLVVAVSTDLLVDLAEPFAAPPWDGMPPFTPDSVRQFVARNLFRDTPATETCGAHEHLARIAYLAVNWVNDGSDPPVVEVLADETLTVQDGYHRLCAAAVRSDEHVWVEVGGWLDTAEALFGIIIP